MEPVSTIFIHVINLILALSTIIMLIVIYLKARKLPKNDFILYMILLPCVAALHIAVFSTVLIIDHLDGVISYPLFYNYWSLFLLMEVILTKLWLSIIAWRKMNKDGKK